MAHINKLSDTLNSRDVIARIEELKELNIPTFSVRQHTKGESTDINEEVEGYYESLDVLHDLIADAEGPVNILLELSKLMVQTAKQEPKEYKVFTYEIGENTFTLSKIKDTNLDDADLEELKHLERFASQGQGYGDWDNGTTLISFDYFDEYIKGTVELPDLPDYVVIDWSATAENLKHDYTHLDLDGQTFLMTS